jgi:CHAT domain-containing protein
MDQALMYYQDALAIHLEVGNLFDEGAAHNNIGVVYVALEQYEEGLDSLQQALGIARRLENRIGEGVVFHNIGHIYGAQGLTEEALANYQMALSIRHEVGDLYGESNSLNSIGTIYVDQGLHEEALTILEEALTIQQEVGDRLGESTTLSNIGFLYGQLGEFEAALEKIELAMDVLETVRSVAGSEEGRASFIAQYAGLYDSAISLYYQQEQVIEAFYSSERSRSRSFLDSMTTGQVELSDDETAVLRDREQAAYNHRRALQNALAEARSLDPPDPEWVAEVELQLAEAEAEYNEALAAIEERGDQLAALVSGRSTVLGLPEVQGLLPEGKTMVYYLVLEEQVLVFLITREGYEVVEIEATREEVTNRVGRWRGLIELRETEASLAEAQALYDLLIAPLSLNTPHLIIVPHGPLHYLPFAALLEAKTGQYLTEQFTLTTIPSASVLPFIQENAEGQGSRGAGEQGGMLVLGNPAVAGFGLEALPAAGREVETIAALYGAAALTGERATERTVWEQAGQSSVLHLAAHGEYNIYNPLYSTIYLAPDAAQPEGAVQPEGLNEKGNGRLEVHEIYGLNLQQTDLVVLSACQTQLGELSAGDELVGLTRAFFFAGTPSVIATLWNVDDEATAFLMERFYTHWREGLSKAAALRQAQIDTQAQPGYEDPFYWAGFVLSGDGGEVSEGQMTLLSATPSPVVAEKAGSEIQEVEPKETTVWIDWGLIGVVVLAGSVVVGLWWLKRHMRI